jgi:hypothetical protein
MRLRILFVAAVLICGEAICRGGGPAFVAGSGYAPGVEGQALIWANGTVQYFTDQGDLSPLLPGAQADALVAAAFSTWTSISSVALTASQGGHLAEDVSGGNIAVDAGGTITAPADITSSATSTPVGIVYDYDGTVTDALLGGGAGGVADCFTNAVYGGPDNFSNAGNIVHALVVINGNCATTNAQLPDVQYRLVRLIGRIFGLGWSQANVNVLTGKPPPTSADFAGFPVMHFADPISCVPISVCYTNADVPKMDDIDALERLYPNSANQQAAGRIYGGLYFTDTSGNALQFMQGVNVVARLMVSGQPSRQYVVSSVSGFLFCGNAGNIIDGYVDGNGLPYNRWGSNDPSLEGFFDLGQLTIPAGQTIAEYQLSVEALDPNWSLGVEPYAPTQVTPSGVFAPVVVTVTAGSNVERDILMLQTEIAQVHPGSGSTYATPAALPQGGAWGSWISGYGSADFFEFKAQANRTASVAVTALDETGQPTETKLLPVIGMWQLSDETGNPAPASTPSAFNSTTFAMTRLDAQFNVTDTFRVAVADFRGDGRPDYFYQAHLLYADTVTPARLSLAGGVTTLNGTGFSPGLQVAAAGNNGTTLSASASQIEVTIPSGLQDGIASIQVTDPVSGAFSQMIGALTYGALSTDLLVLVQGAEPATPVGSVAANALRVRAVAADGITPVNGATIAWSATNGLQFSACSGGTSCSVLTDEAGESSTSVTPTATGQSSITIALAPASYSPPQVQQATVLATSSALDLVALTPTRWVAQGATTSVPIIVEALDLGSPMANVAVNFLITKGAASLSAPSATTNGSGFATITAQLTNQTADVQVSACVAPNNAPCQTFTFFSTAPALWELETVSGSLQVVPVGQSFQPLAMRVTDGSPAANPVMGVTVTFETTLARTNANLEGQQDADSNVGANGVAVILGSSQAQVVTTQDGLASIVPSVGNLGPCDVFITVSAAQLTAQFQMEEVAAIPSQPPNNGPPQSPPVNPGTHTAPIIVPVGVRNFGSPASMLLASPEGLFAVPEGMAINTVDSQPQSQSNDCSELPTDDFSLDRGDSTAPSPASNEKPASSTCASSSPIGTEIPNENKAHDQVAEMVNEAVSIEAAVAAEAQPPDSGGWQAEDKRSCRVLATDGLFH